MTVNGVKKVLATDYTLVDGTVTSQPEFSFWFKDVGWEVENYGTDVDIEVENLPGSKGGTKSVPGSTH